MSATMNQFCDTLGDRLKRGSTQSVEWHAP
jgi:hypothetical protein